VKFLWALTIAAALSLAPTFGFARSGAEPTATPTALPAVAATPNAAVLARAKDWLHRLQIGDIDKAQLTDAMIAGLTPQVAASIAAQTGPLGDPKTMTLAATKTVSGNTFYVYKVVFKSATWDFIFATDDKSGKVSGLQITPQ
jgi:hypothetical protein